MQRIEMYGSYCDSCSWDFDEIAMCGEAIIVASSLTWMSEIISFPVFKMDTSVVTARNLSV